MKILRVTLESERPDKRAPLFWRMANASIQDDIRRFTKAREGK